MTEKLAREYQLKKRIRKTCIRQYKQRHNDEKPPKQILRNMIGVLLKRELELDKRPSVVDVKWLDSDCHLLILSTGEHVEMSRFETVHNGKRPKLVMIQNRAHRCKVPDRSIKAWEKSHFAWWRKKCEQDAKLAAQFQATEDLPEDLKPKPKRKRILRDRSVTSVIRWMATDAWTKEEVRTVLDALLIPITDATIATQLRAGVSNKQTHGPPAKLTDAEIEELYRLLDDEE